MPWLKPSMAGDFPETQLAAWRNFSAPKKSEEMPGEAQEVQPGLSRSKSLSVTTFGRCRCGMMWAGAGSWKQRSSVFSARNGGPTESRQSVIFLGSSWDRQLLGQQLNWNTNYTYHRKSSDMFTVFFYQHRVALNFVTRSWLDMLEVVNQLPVVLLVEVES